MDFRTEENCLKLGFSKMTFEFFQVNKIYRLEQLACKSGYKLMCMRQASIVVFRNIVEVLDKCGLRLIDCSEEAYPTVEEYIKEYEEDYSYKAKKPNAPTEEDDLGDISELSLKPRLITLLRKVGINKISELLLYSRDALMETKVFGVNGIESIAQALCEKKLVLKGDVINTCIKCKTKFSSISDKNIEKCSECILKENRVDGVKFLSVSLNKAIYSGFTDIKSGFYIIANVKNLTNELLKVKLEEFFIVTSLRQYSPKYFLTGYSFNEELLMPRSVKSIAKIWDLSEMNVSQLRAGTEAFVSLRILGEKNKLLMYKFVMNDTLEWEIDDFFTW